MWLRVLPIKGNLVWLGSEKSVKISKNIEIFRVFPVLSEYTQKDVVVERKANTTITLSSIYTNGNLCTDQVPIM